MLSQTDGTNTTPPPIIHGLFYHEEMFNLLRSIVSKSANAEFTTAPCWLVATQGAIDWKVALAGRALDRSGWLTMLQTANYLERTAKSEDIVCFPRLWSNKTLNKEERRFFTLLLAQLFLKVRIIGLLLIRDQGRVAHFLAAGLQENGEIMRK